MKRLPILLVTALVLSGCHQPPPKHTVYLIDDSASIVPAAFNQAMETIASQAAQLRRGDCITVIPIIGDADAIPPGEIVHACVPAHRTLYDQDLRQFRQKLTGELTAQRRQLSAHRSAKTDIFGSLDLAEQDFSSDPLGTVKTLVIYSDFIEDDETYNFATSPDLGSQEASERLARQIAQGGSSESGDLSCNWHGTGIILGRLQSAELPDLPRERRDAIHHFWHLNFRLCNAGSGQDVPRLEGVRR